MESLFCLLVLFNAQHFIAHIIAVNYTLGYNLGRKIEKTISSRKSLFHQQPIRGNTSAAAFWGHYLIATHDKLCFSAVFFLFDPEISVP